MIWIRTAELPDSGAGTVWCFIEHLDRGHAQRGMVPVTPVDRSSGSRIGLGVAYPIERWTTTSRRIDWAVHAVSPVRPGDANAVMSDEDGRLFGYSDTPARHVSPEAPFYPSKVHREIDADWSPPNIVLIVADDLGRNDIGCYGGTHIPTPALDRIAREGMRCTDAYGGHPVCAPSRDVLLTGRHTGHTTLRGNMSSAGVGGMRVVDDGAIQHRVGLMADDLTIAEFLSGSGYVTGAMGKWGLGEPGTDAIPTRKGFDRWFGYLNQRRAHTYYPPYLWDDETRLDFPGNQPGTTGVDDGPYAHDLIEAEALSFIHEHSGDQFFAYLPYTLPHAELVVPEVDSFVDPAWSEDEQAYASMVARFDRSVGNVVDVLEDEGIDRDTLVIVTVDHGADADPSRFESTKPLRGHKRALYDGGIRVPALFRWPDMIPAGSVCERPWYFADVFPTLAEVAGRPQPSLPGQVDGVSIVPTLLGDDQPGLARRYLYWERSTPDGLGQAGRYGDWKAVRPDRAGPTELYDLAADEGESTDLAAEHPEVVGRFERYFRDAHDESPYWPSW